MKRLTLCFNVEEALKRIEENVEYLEMVSDTLNVLLDALPQGVERAMLLNIMSALHGIKTAIGALHDAIVMHEIREKEGGKKANERST